MTCRDGCIVQVRSGEPCQMVCQFANGPGYLVSHLGMDGTTTGTRWVDLGAAPPPDAVSWTIGEALAFLDPVPPRRTLSRWLAGMTPDGERPLPQGGRPARTYPARQIMAEHARWVARGS